MSVSLCLVFVCVSVSLCLSVSACRSLSVLLSAFAKILDFESPSEILIEMYPKRTVSLIFLPGLSLGAHELNTDMMRRAKTGSVCLSVCLRVYLSVY